MDRNTEGYEEAGRVVAHDKGDAERKLKQHGLKAVSLKKMQGMAAFFGRLTAEIK